MEPPKTPITNPEQDHRLKGFIESYFNEDGQKKLIVSALNAGWSSAALYLIRVGNKAYVACLQDLSKTSRLKECYMLKQTSQKKISPQIHFIDEESGIILMDYINAAKTISFEDLDQKSVTALGKTLKKAHKIPKPPYHLERLWDKVQRHFSTLASLNLVDENRSLLKTRFQDLYNKLDALKFPKTTIHGDLHIKNIFLTEQNSIQLIDWEGTRYDDPFFDIAYSSFTLTLDEKLEETYLASYLGYLPNEHENNHYTLCKKITALGIHFELLEWAYVLNDHHPVMHSHKPALTWENYMHTFNEMTKMPAAEFIYDWAHSILSF